MITAVDNQGFAGGMTLGMARAGIEVIAKREEADGFGVPIVDDNRALINVNLDIQASEPKQWVRRKANVVFGNPPCSAFSGMLNVKNTSGDTRGVDHRINACMWNLVEYAALCQPDFVVMESVQGAYTQGRELMQNLRSDMVFRTGRPYDLIHVLHNNASVGGASVRRRYFMVLARPGLKFGIVDPAITYVPRLSELLYDLENLPADGAWGPKMYRRKPKRYVLENELRRFPKVDGHATIQDQYTRRIEWICNNGDWSPMEHIGDPMRRAIKKVGFENVPAWMKHPDGSQVWAHLLTTNAYASRRWDWDRAGRVIMSWAGRDFIHPTQPRPISFREAARIMGYPDDWSLRTMERGVKMDQRWLGKGISVPCGEWIGKSIVATYGDDRRYRGELIGEKEYLINMTNDFKAVHNEWTGDTEDSRPRSLVREMESRTWIGG